VTVFSHSSEVAAPTDEVFAWHERPGAFERLVPPWQEVRVLERTGTIRNGDRTVLQMKVGPKRVRWVALHKEYEPPRRFVDEQVEGPFAEWLHTHTFTPAGDGACGMEDRIVYRLPMGGLGRLVAGRKVRRDLERTFRFRHARLAADLARHRALGLRPQRIAVTGATGLVGRALTAFLTTGGHTVLRLVRREARPGADEVSWDPRAGSVDAAALEGVDAVVHLAGESIAGGRWTDEKKRRIRESRTAGTRLIAEALAGLDSPPQVLVSASAIGWYGDRPGETVDESSPAGEGFLADVCRAWEDACQPARDAGVRVVNMRLGVVLSPQGGALAQLLGPFRKGAGGVVGSGEQVMSWVDLDDVVGAIHHALGAGGLTGAVNVTAPTPVTNREFTKTLGRVLRRPTIAPLPAFAVRLAFGEMGQELLLAGARILPKALEEAGFRFREPGLESCLREMLGRPAPI
jgi:uncharacterized protein (TIGR01777 family)